jgi:hypothetical protein
MTTTLAKHAGQSVSHVLGVALILGTATGANALTLDGEGDVKLGLRTYTAVRVGTEAIGEQNEFAYPRSPAGHLRQHRSFVQLDFSHDIADYARRGYGYTRLLFGLIKPDVLSYTLQYRGEFEGIYDYGPSEYENYERELRRFRRDVPSVAFLGLTDRLDEAFIQRRVRRLSRVGRDRHRLFLAYLDFEKGPLFIRLGRQVLAWGETDVFRLLDNINPVDDSFGGFFIPLDERRVPIEMLRANWHFGSFGRFSDVFLEGFLAAGNRTSQQPGAPEGSPWVPGGLATPNNALRRVHDTPDREAFRGGARLVFGFSDITFTLAHYYTYLDIPGVRFTLPGCRPRPAGGAPCTIDNVAGPGNEIIASQEFPRVPITGLAMTFPVPSWYTIVRSELAWFKNEPMNRQGQGPSARAVDPLGSRGARKLRDNTEGGLDPFLYPAFLDLSRVNKVHGSVLQRDTFNFALGADINRFVRFLNPHQTFFISTQFFYKHVFDSPGDLVLPVLHRNIPVASNAPIVGTNTLGCLKNPKDDPNDFTAPRRNCRLRPRLFHLDDDRFLHTLLITTSYGSGRIVPSFGAFYDWQGAWVFQPGVALIRDPFRFIFDYTAVSAAPTGQFGAVRDRDNVRFQVEFVF